MKTSIIVCLALSTVVTSAQFRVQLASDSTDARKYAPNRDIDILHLTLDVTPDFKVRTVAGTATLRFKPIVNPLAELKLDAVDLGVSNVTSSARILGWQASDKNVTITFEPPVPLDQETTVTITYDATPKQGLYFRTPEMGYEPGDTHLWTQGETIEARHWFPCFDAPNEKFTSEIICRVPPDMTVLSNGRLISETNDGGGLKASVWMQDKPHTSYLIALAAGYFKGIHDQHGDVPLGFYTPASQIAQATNSFYETKDMMQFFEREIGVPYPWAKYYQVCVDDFTAGGMENTSLTILNDGTLHTTATENLEDSRGLIAHELAHQWFGDLVTCKDWSHVWLNEGFATYYEHLYDGYKEGRDRLRYRMYSSAKGFMDARNDTNAIVRRNFRSADEQFGFHAYSKGAWILHMLREQLGEDQFRRCVKTYLERYQYANATTEDFSKIIEEVSGRNFDQFFDQYVYHAQQPTLDITYNWDERAKLAKLTVTQSQKVGDDVLLFNVPLTVRFKGKFGTVNKTLQVKQVTEEFSVALPEAPENVRIDPEVALLAKINFTPSRAMLNAQLADADDMMGRLLAVEQLRGKRDALDKLKKVLNNDPDYEVRIAASQGIRAIPGQDSLPALIASSKQSDARVRRQVISDIATFYSEVSYDELIKVVRDEKNPEIKAATIVALGAYGKPEVHEILLANLDADSYQNALAAAAVSGMRAQDDASYVAPLLASLRAKGTNYTTGGFARALDALAWLARNQEKKEEVREFLLGYINSPKRRVQMAAITGLGTLGDAKAIAPLQKLANAPKESFERTAAEKSIASLRDVQKPAAELGSLRNEVLALQRQNRELRTELDDVKKKLDTLATNLTAAGGKSAKPKAPLRSPKG